MDSEEEVAEEQGEDIDKKANSDEEDEEPGSDEEDKDDFIVSDGHLSVEEYEFSQDEGDEAKKLAEIQGRRERLKQIRENQLN